MVYVIMPNSIPFAIVDFIFNPFMSNETHQYRFGYKGCWVVSFSFIQILQVHSVSK